MNWRRNLKHLAKWLLLCLAAEAMVLVGLYMHLGAKIGA